MASDQFHNRLSKAQADIGQAMWDEFGATVPGAVEAIHPDVEKAGRLAAAMFFAMVKAGMDEMDAVEVVKDYLAGLVFNPDHPHMQLDSP